MKVKFLGDYACECADLLWEPGEVKDVAAAPDSQLFAVVDGASPMLVVKQPIITSAPAPVVSEGEK